LQSLTGAPGLDVEFGAGARKRDRRVTLIVARSGKPRRLAHLVQSRAARDRLAQVAFETREEQIERAPALGFGGEPGLAFAHRGKRAVAEHGERGHDRQRDEHFEQRESGPARAHQRWPR
jgi:hypothetical protein